MHGKTKILGAVSALLLLALTLTWAQPGGGRRGGGGGGEAGGISAEQLLGYLALSPDIMLRDEQLLNVRNALRGSYGEQMELLEAMRGRNVDGQATQASLEGLRKSMISAASAVLTKQQSERMKTAIEQMGGRGGGGRRR